MSRRLRYIGKYRIEASPGCLRIRNVDKTFVFMLWFWLGVLVMGFVVHTIDWSSFRDMPSGAVFALIICLLGGWGLPLYLFSTGGIAVFDSTGFTIRGYVLFWKCSSYRRFPLEEIQRFDVVQEKVKETHEGFVFYEILLVAREVTFSVFYCQTALEADSLANLLNTHLTGFQGRDCEKALT